MSNLLIELMELLAQSRTLPIAEDGREGRAFVVLVKFKVMASTQQLLPVSLVKTLLFTSLEYGNKLNQMDYSSVKTALELIIKGTR